MMDIIKIIVKRVILFILSEFMRLLTFSRLVFDEYTVNNVEWRFF